MSHLHNRIPHSNNRTLAPATHTHSRLATQPTTISPAIPYMPLLRPSPTPTPTPPTPAPTTTTITHTPPLDSPPPQFRPSSTTRVSLALAAAPVCMYVSKTSDPAFPIVRVCFSNSTFDFPFPFVRASLPQRPRSPAKTSVPYGRMALIHIRHSIPLFIHSLFRIHPSADMNHPNNAARAYGKVAFNYFTYHQTGGRSLSIPHIPL